MSMNETVVPAPPFNFGETVYINWDGKRQQKRVVTGMTWNAEDGFGRQWTVTTQTPDLDPNSQITMYQDCNVARKPWAVKVSP